MQSICGEDKVEEQSPLLPWRGGTVEGAQQAVLERAITIVQACQGGVRNEAGHAKVTQLDCSESDGQQ